MSTDPKHSAGLKGFQRTWLRGRAHPLKQVVQVGQGGVTDQVIEAVNAALLAHELIKVRLMRPDDKRGTANAVALRAGAELCGLVGHTAILYRAHPEKPKIVLPQRKEDATPD